MLASIIVFDSKQREITSLPISGVVSRIGSSEICQLRIQGLPEVLGTLQLIDGGFRLINKTASDLWLGEVQVAPGAYAIWPPGESINLGAQGRLQLVIGARINSSGELLSSPKVPNDSEFDYRFPTEGPEGKNAEIAGPSGQENKSHNVMASLLTIVVCLAACAGMLYFVFSDSAPAAKGGAIGFGAIMQQLEQASGDWKEPSQQWQVELQQCWLLLNRGEALQARERLLKLRESVTKEVRSTTETESNFDSKSLIKYIDQELAK